jgi:hypothetical protein
VDLVNTSRVRVSARMFHRGYGERPRVFRLTTYKSRDHGMPRQESNYAVEVLGMVWHLKWRPDGKPDYDREG